MSLYRQVLKEAWQITWRYKFLWLFGFLASFWGIGAAYEIIFRSLTISPEPAQNLFFFQILQDMGSNGLSGQVFIEFLLTASPLALFNFFLFPIITVLVAFIFYYIFTCGQIALIKAIDGVETGRQTFSGLFFSSGKKFWSVFGVNLLGKVIIGLLLFLLSYPFLAPLLKFHFSWVNFLIYLVAFIVVFLLVLIISFLMVYATIYLVVKGETFWSAVLKSWQLFLANWLVSLESAFVLFLVSIAVAFVVLIGSLLLFLPFTILSWVFTALQSTIGFWFIFLLAVLTAVAVVVLTVSALTTFQLAVWVVLFERMEKGKAESKLQRLTS